ncbi:MAG: nucleoside triphosphate pyrophosphohydrolase [Gammaproteobacteria bacterium]|nr:nucleoside triphosphate pyrophosphohydrolase [Gammaproteobacteria bacterium]
MREPERNIQGLLELMATLRDPERGCPWDREQDFSTIAPYTVEEAYEVEDAIQRNDLDDLKDELGDLLFQVVFHARMAEEQGAFAFNDVVANLVEKMTRRHPHVFGNEDFGDAETQTANWEALKAEEKAAKREKGESLLDDVPLNLPALTRAEKLSKRAARVGFEWPDIDGVLDKVAEEAAELRDAVKANRQQEIEEELGDLFFTLANLARYLKVDPEKALRGSNAKFSRRFRHVEDRLAGQDRSLDDASLDEMDALWNEARANDKNPD